MCFCVFSITYNFILICKSGGFVSLTLAEVLLLDLTRLPSADRTLLGE